MLNCLSEKVVRDVDYRAPPEYHHKKYVGHSGCNLRVVGGSHATDEEGHGKVLQVTDDHRDEGVGHHMVHPENRLG